MVQPNNPPARQELVYDEMQRLKGENPYLGSLEAFAIARESTGSDALHHKLSRTFPGLPSLTRGEISLVLERATTMLEGAMETISSECPWSTHKIQVTGSHMRVLSNTRLECVGIGDLNNLRDRDRIIFILDTDQFMAEMPIIMETLEMFGGWNTSDPKQRAGFLRDASGETLLNLAIREKEVLKVALNESDLHFQDKNYTILEALSLLSNLEEHDVLDHVREDWMREEVINPNYVLISRSQIAEQARNPDALYLRAKRELSEHRYEVSKLIALAGVERYKNHLDQGLRVEVLVHEAEERWREELEATMRSQPDERLVDMLTLNQKRQERIDFCSYVVHSIRRHRGALIQFLKN